ncbi:MAG: DUF4142 domain-containing protein [Bdellovibrionota bacterium]
MKRLIAISLLSLMASAAHSAEKFTDGQVSQILTTRNDGEVLLARHVLDNSKNAAVKEFAQHMLDDHSLNNMQKKNITSTKAITGEESWKSAELQKEISASQKKIFALKGKALDIAYIDDQIKIHEGMVEGIQQNLIPVAKEPALKKHLEMTVRKDEIHLNQARAVRWTL